MSENSNNNNSEEIDLGQLFNAIGKVFDRFINFIITIIKFIFSTFIHAIKPLIINFKLIALIVILAGVLGYAYQKIKAPKYNSEMLVKTYFEAKYQLVTNINYFNALLEDEDYNTLSSIFKIDDESARKIIQFEIEPGPETENDRIIQYDRFVRSIDSVRAQEISFEDFVENRDIHSGDLFIIRVEALQKDIFRDLETGLNRSFDNAYSIKKMEKRDSMIAIKKQNLEAQIEEIKQLQKVYIDVLEEESQSAKASVNLGEGFPLQQEKSETKEYQLLNQEIKLRNELRALDEQKIEENVFFDVISSFQLVGNRSETILDKYVLVFPTIAFILLIIGYLIKRVVSFTLSYE